MVLDKVKINRILIMRSDGIGDFILSLPALNALRKNYPSAYIALFTCNWQEPIAKNTGLFDKIIIWDNSKNFYLTNPTRFRYFSYRIFKYIPELKSLKFDVAIDFKDDLRNRIIMVCCGIKFRIGFDCGWSKVFLNHAIPYQEGLHKAVSYTKLVNPFLGDLPVEPYIFNVKEEDSLRAESFILSESISREDRIVVMHPVARWQAKTWPARKFADLADRLLSIPGVKVIFCGAKEDLSGINKIKGMMRMQPAVSAGKLDFLQTAAVIKRSKVFVGNDAAPMHMAGLLNIPTVALFGSTDPGISSPMGDKTIVIRKIASRCRGCFKKDTGKCIFPDKFCMDKISVEEVFNVCLKYL